MNTMKPEYEDLLIENAKLRLEIAEAMKILRPGGTVDGQGNEIPNTLVERARNVIDILDCECMRVRELEKELHIDPFESEFDIVCRNCGSLLEQVRPGKHQCNYCEGMNACHHYGLCAQNNYPTFGPAGCCKVCPLKEES